MQTIKRDIYVTKNVLQAPIEVTEGTNSIALEFDIKDYTIPGTAAAVVYSMCTSTMAEPNKALAEVDGNTITIIPSESFFHAGQNVMQIRVIDGDSKLISFNIIVQCFLAVLSKQIFFTRKCFFSNRIVHFYCTLKICFYLRCRN